MPLQNRVAPTGEIVAVPERGLLMGNRGILHDEHKAWLICRTEFRGRHRDVMTPRRYTELFFFDEATAIAAGHRPCHECRRQDFLAWRAAWQRAQGLKAPLRAPEMDAKLHGERTGLARWTARVGDLPDGAFVLWDGTACLILGGRLHPWSWQGYGAPVGVPASVGVTVLTPPSSVAVLQSGYRTTIKISASALKAPVESDN
jgi:hypothetical protein